MSLSKRDNEAELDVNTSLTPREPDILLEMENLFGISDMYKKASCENKLKLAYPFSSKTILY